MYLINWNPGSSRLEANFGGCITEGEASVFLEELQEQLDQVTGQEFSLVLDFATTKRLENGVMDLFCAARKASQVAGASKVVFVAHDEAEAVDLTDSRLQEVLEGREEYVSFKYAS